MGYAEVGDPQLMELTSKVTSIVGKLMVHEDIVTPDIFRTRADDLQRILHEEIQKGIKQEYPDFDKHGKVFLNINDSPPNPQIGKWYINAHIEYKGKHSEALYDFELTQPEEK
jgi:hypothetical protein